MIIRKSINKRGESKRLVVGLMVALSAFTLHCGQSREPLTDSYGGVEYDPGTYRSRNQCEAVDADHESGLLLAAAQRGDIESVKNAIDNCADINARASDQFDSTVLMLAIKNGHNEVVRLLIEREADLNATDNRGFTVLMVAVENGHADIVSLLIRNGAAVNYQNRSGETALMIAVESGNMDNVRVLVEDGRTDISRFNSNGDTALMYAAFYNNREIAAFLIENGPPGLVNFPNKDRVTALMTAAMKGYAEIVRILLDNNANVNDRDNAGWTALKYARENGHSVVVQILMEAGGRE